MLPKESRIFISNHPDDLVYACSIKKQLKEAGWLNTYLAENDRNLTRECIQNSDVFIPIISLQYILNEHLLLEEFTYAATGVNKSCIPAWTKSPNIISNAIKTQSEELLLSAVEMLTARYHEITTFDGVVHALSSFWYNDLYKKTVGNRPCDKPFKAFDGNSDDGYIFVSYAHCDAEPVYRVIKGLYENGWELWYDQGIRVSEMYLSEISLNLKKSSLFLLMLTDNCINRPFVMDYELEYARRLNIPIVPVLLEDSIEVPGNEKPVRLDELAACIESFSDSRKLINQGKRTAVPPKDQSKYTYDIPMPPEIPGFKYEIEENIIELRRYIGNDEEVFVPYSVCTQGGDFTYSVCLSEGLHGVFENCKTLKSVTFEEGISVIPSSTFKGCRALSRVVLPEGVRKIESAAFRECFSLTEINIPSSVEYIGMGAFYLCKELDNIYIPDSVASIHGDAFFATKMHVYERGIDHKTEIDAFLKIEPPYYQKLKEINTVEFHDSPMPKCKETPRALVVCADEDISLISDLIIELYWEGFNVYYDTEPSDETIENSDIVLLFFTENTDQSDKQIDLLNRSICLEKKIIQAFWGEYFWNKVKNIPINIVNSLRNLQAIAGFGEHQSRQQFDGLIRDALRDAKCCLDSPRFNFSISENVVKLEPFIPTGFPKVIVPEYFSPNLKLKCIEGDAFSDCKKLTSISIPDCIEHIGMFAFARCESLTEFVIPNSVKTLGDSAFKQCISLKYINIPENIKTLEGYTFSHCSALSRVDINHDLETIGSGVFYGCKALKYITIPESVTCISSSAFDGCPNVTIRTSKGSYASKFAESNNIKVEILKESEGLLWDTLEY